MELNILDSSFRRVTLVETFKSFIWTERFTAFGDFQLVVVSNAENRATFTKGLRLCIKESSYLMTIETVVDALDTDGSKTLKITGRSLEAFCDERVIARTMEPLDPNTNNWTITGTPGEVMRAIFYSQLLSGFLNSHDALPTLVDSVSDDLSSPDFYREPTEVIVWTQKTEMVYTALKALADIYELGFKLYRRSTDDSTLYFSVYPGTDRTSSGSSPVVFSTLFENLQNTTEVNSTETSRNVAYVVSPYMNVIQYAPGVPETISGFDRRVLLVQADDVDAPPALLPEPDPGPEPTLGEPPDPGPQPQPDGPQPEGMEGGAIWYENWQNAVATWNTARVAANAAWMNAYNTAHDTWNNNKIIAESAWHAANLEALSEYRTNLLHILQQRGLLALAQSKNTYAFDGEIKGDSYIYGVDYNLGDLVELRDDDGTPSVKRVTEQIFVSDKEGDRSYPTLSDTGY